MLCFMSIEENCNVVEENNLTNNDLLCAFDELHEEMKKISKKK